MNDRFRQVEDEYFRLKGQLMAGRITREQFEASLKEMMVQDLRGRWWTLGVDDGKWYVHDGARWNQAAPPMSTPGPGPLPPIQVAAPQVPMGTRASRANSRAPVLVVGAGVIALVLGLLAAAAGGLLTPKGVVVIVPYATTTPAAQQMTPEASLAPTSGALASSNVPGVNVSVVSLTTPAPIAARDFGALNAQLAQKIAALNQAQLKFIRDVRASSSNGRLAGLAFPAEEKGTLTEQDIKVVAGKAMDVGILADQMGEMATKQDNGSAKATQSADAYYAIARNALSLVIDAQNVRQALQSGIIPGGQAIDIIAQYGAQLWNTAVTDGNTKGNPFSAQTKNSEPVQSLNAGAAKQVQSQISANNSSIWIAQSATQNPRTVNVPAPQSSVSNLFDPQVKNSLTTADGQSDGNNAQQVAAANLEALGAKATTSDPSKQTQLQVQTNPVAVSGGDQLRAGNIPTFQSGRATTVSKNAPGDDNAFMQTFGLNGEQTPSDQGKTTVQDAPALVSLSLSNIVIGNVNKRPKGSGTFEADVTFSFTVNWSTNLAAPQFTLNCNSGLTNAVAQASGTLNLNANGLLILYPGTLNVYCYANSTNGQSLGSVSVNVLVGDAAGATARAIQVETDSANLNATLTAEAVGTFSVQQTQTASANAQATQTAQAQQTMDAVSTEVDGSATAEFKLTASAFETRQAQPTVPPPPPTSTPTFTPKVVDQVFHPGNVFAVSTKVVLQRGRLYRFTFSGLVNLINPTRSVSANQLPEHVNGVAVPASGIVVIEGTGGVATISCGSGEPDPQDPGGYTITVEDLGPS
jgi:hypothetical protein